MHAVQVLAEVLRGGSRCDEDQRPRLGVIAVLHEQRVPKVHEDVLADQRRRALDLGRLAPAVLFQVLFDI